MRLPGIKEKVAANLLHDYGDDVFAFLKDLLDIHLTHIINNQTVMNELRSRNFTLFMQEFFQIDNFLITELGLEDAHV